MTDRAAAEEWVDGYVRAWASSDPEDIAALFTPDAIYKPTPMSDGWRGRDAVVAGWLGRKEDPADWRFEHEIIAIDRDLAVVRGVTTYKPPEDTFENLWLVWLSEDGRAREFIEYDMARPKPEPGAGEKRAHEPSWKARGDDVIGQASAEDWVQRYLRAWASNDGGEIAALFTDDAVYKPTPMSTGWRGREAIVEGWLERKDDPGDWQFEYELVATDGDLAVVTGVTTYKPPYDTYENLWLIRLTEDGRAREFVEYWIAQPKPDG